MQKPEFIKISIPIGKNYAPKLFCSFINYLKNRNAVLNFASERNRKYFDYKIIDSKISDYGFITVDKKNYNIEITLKKIIN